MAATFPTDLKAVCHDLELRNWPREEFIELLALLPPEDEYHPNHSARYIGRHFRSSLPAFKDVLEDKRLDIERRYQAFMAIGTAHHNTLDFSALDDLIASYGQTFAKKYRARIIRTLSYRNKSIDDFLASLVVMADIEVAMNEDPGYLYHYSELIVLACEEYERFPSRDKLIGKARMNTNKAILILPYAKYYSLLGHIALLQSDFVAAKAHVQKAIDLEDSSRADYYLRIQSYHNLANIINLRRATQDVLASVRSDVDKQFRVHDDTIRSKQLEFIGFFVAIMSFVISGYGIARNYPATEASELIFMTASSLIAAVAGFTILTSSSIRVGRFALQILLSALLFFVAIFGIPFLKSRLQSLDPATVAQKPSNLEKPGTAAARPPTP